MSWGPILHIFFAKAGCWIRSKRSEWRQQGRGQGTAGVLLLLIVLGISTACLACLAGPAHSWHVFVKLGFESWISSCSCSKYSKPLRIIAIFWLKAPTPLMLKLFASNQRLDSLFFDWCGCKWRLSIDPDTHLCDRKFVPLCQRCSISGVPIMSEVELTEFIRSSLLMPN